MSDGLREGYPFTDADGRIWHVIDFKTVSQPGGAAKRRRVPIGSHLAEGRAFVPDPWDGDRSKIMIERWGTIAYRDYDELRLQQALDGAYPSTATAGERMQPRPYPPDRSEWRNAILGRRPRERGEQ